MIEIGRMRFLSLLVLSAVLFGCQTTPYRSFPTSGASLKRIMEKRFPPGTPGAEVRSALEKEKYSCRPIVNGDLLIESDDFSRAEGMMCMKFIRVPAGERIMKVRFQLEDDRVGEITAEVERFRPESKTFQYR